jgi:hypothetical protein
MAEKKRIEWAVIVKAVNDKTLAKQIKIFQTDPS